jgi:hypothetical protein
MSTWKDVGNWLKGNAGTGAVLVGSLLTGNVPAAVAAGVSLVSSAAGSNDPSVVLESLQNDPATVVRLKELTLQNEQSIRQHVESMARLDLENQQAQHHETQETIRAGDKAEDRFVRWTRPAQSWLSLLAALGYALFNLEPDEAVLMLLLTLPWAYAGLRQIGKSVDSYVEVKANAKQKGAG